MEAPWYHAMVANHGQVLADLIHVICTEANVVGPEHARGVLLYVVLAKNRRFGRTGYSPRALIYGLDERWVTSGLVHVLEHQMMPTW